MTEFEDLKKQENECKAKMAACIFRANICRKRFDEWHKKYKTIKDKLAVLEIEEAVSQL